MILVKTRQLKKYTEWESPHLVFATSSGEHRLWDGTGLGGTPVARSHPTHHKVFLLGMGFTIVDNARKVQKFPFPIVIFRNLKLGGNRPLLLMKFLEFILRCHNIAQVLPC